MASRPVNTNSRIIVQEIDNYICSWGGIHTDWYVGIAENPRERLFADHRVREFMDRWIYCECRDSEQARAIEQAFLSVGCRGGSGGGNSESRWVYAYRIMPHTKE